MLQPIGLRPGGPAPYPPVAMPPKPDAAEREDNPESLDRESVLRLAESLAAMASEFAHDANNLVLQVVMAQELAGDSLGSPIATEPEIERITQAARNVTTIARDLARLVEQHGPATD